MKIIQNILLIMLFLINLEAKDIKPNFTYIAKGGVTDLISKNNKLYVATTASSVDIFDLTNKKFINSITLPKIKDFMGDIIDSKIYSIDVRNNKVLILSQGEKGGRSINIHTNNTLNEIISDKKRMFIAKAKFIDDSKIIFSLLSNQVYLFDLNNNKIIKEAQVSQSKFSDFVLSEDKKNVIIADESGILRVLNTSTLEEEMIFENQNLDNVFQVDTKNGIILTAGQDRRSAIYSLKNNISYHKKANFLVYSAGLSPSGILAGFASDEDNNVTIFDTSTKIDLHKLIDNPATLTKILFINEKEVFVSSDHEKINYYKLD